MQITLKEYLTNSVLEIFTYKKRKEALKELFFFGNQYKRNKFLFHDDFEKVMYKNYFKIPTKGKEFINCDFQTTIFNIGSNVVKTVVYGDYFLEIEGDK